MNVVQTKFGADIGFSLRTFWFNAETSSSTGQKQTMECNIRLDPVAAVSSSQPNNSQPNDSQPNDCTCHTRGECSPQGNVQICKVENCTDLFTMGYRLWPLLTSLSDFSTWTGWSSCSASCGSGQQTRTRTCYQGCSSQDLSETQSCNDAACPGKPGCDSFVNFGVHHIRPKA